MNGSRDIAKCQKFLCEKADVDIDTEADNNLAIPIQLFKNSLKILPFGKGMKKCMHIYTWSESNADTVRTGVPMEYSSETVLTYGALIHDEMPGFRFTVMATSAVS